MSAVAGIAAVPGVTAAVLYDEAGRRIDARAVTPGGAGSALDDAARALGRAMAVMAVGGAATGLFARTTEGWILSRRLGGHTLLVTGHGPPRTALLDVALAVVASRTQPAGGHGRRVSAATARLAPERGRPVGVEVVKALLGTLSRHVGAQGARATLTRELAALGESPHTVTHELYPYLVDRLALRITDPASQARFRRDARDLPEGTTAG